MSYGKEKKMKPTSEIPHPPTPPTPPKEKKGGEKHLQGIGIMLLKGLALV